MSISAAVCQADLLVTNNGCNGHGGIRQDGNFLLTVDPTQRVASIEVNGGRKDSHISFFLRSPELEGLDITMTYMNWKTRDHRLSSEYVQGNYSETIDESI